MHFLGAEHFSGIHLPSVQDLAAQRHHGLELAIPGGLRRATGRVALDQEQLAPVRILGRAIDQLAGQSRPGCDRLAGHFLARLRAALRIGDRQLRQRLAIARMLVQPEAEGVLRDAGHEDARLARGQPLLGLAAELWLGELGGQHVGALFKEVLAADLEAARKQVAEFAELPQRIHEPAAQARDMGTARGSGNQVDVALGDRRAVGHPLQCPLGGFVVACCLVVEWRRREVVASAERLGQVPAQTTFETPDLGLGWFRAAFHGQRDGEPGAQHGLGAQQVPQLGVRNPDAVEILGVGHETDAGARVPLADAVDHLQGRVGLATDESLPMDGPAPFHLDEEPRRQRVDHGHANAVQAASEAVIGVIELAAGVQLGQDQLDARELVLGMHVDRHATTVVDHLDGAVAAKRDVDGTAIAAQDFVDAVVNHLLHQVVGARRVGVHPGPPTHRIQPGKHLDGLGGVGLSHR